MWSFFKNVLTPKLFEAAPVLCYFALVWGFAAIRQDYFWITGDDPNLLVQAMLTASGKTPNFDFESGYPGLSQFMQGILISWFGASVWSQHLYTAVLASITGLTIFVIFKHLPRLLISILLVLVYCQQHLVNPTPNPGHLFESILLVGVLILKRFKTLNLAFFVSASSFLAIASLAKQYGLILIFGLAISRLSILKIAIPRFALNTFTLFLGIASCLLYFFFWIPDKSRESALLNLFIFLAPFLILFFCLQKSEGAHPLNVLSFRKALTEVITIAVTFLSVFTLGLLLLYPKHGFHELIQNLFVNSPRFINKNIVTVHLELGSLLQTFSLITFTTAALYAISDRFQKSLFLFIFLPILGLGSLVVMGNLSSSVALAVVPSLIFLFHRYKLRSFNERDRLVYFTLVFFHVILIPYPNSNFIFVAYLLAFGYFLSRLPLIGYSRGSMRSHVLLFGIVGALLFHEQQYVGSLPSYNFEKVSFVSGSPTWKKSIAEATAVKGDYSLCPNIACSALVLLAHKSSRTENRTDYISNKF